jgi:hypothetical protein
MRNNAHYLYNLLNKGRGSIDASLGKQPYRFLGKNPVSGNSKSKSVYLPKGWGGNSGKYFIGVDVGLGDSENFSINFTSSGFIDG